MLSTAGTSAAADFSVLLELSSYIIVEFCVRLLPFHTSIVTSEDVAETSVVSTLKALTSTSNAFSYAAFALETA